MSDWTLIHETVCEEQDFLNPVIEMDIWGIGQVSVVRDEKTGEIMWHNDLFRVKMVSAEKAITEAVLPVLDMPTVLGKMIVSYLLSPKLVSITVDISLSRAVSLGWHHLPGSLRRLIDLLVRSNAKCIDMETLSERYASACIPTSNKSRHSLSFSWKQVPSDFWSDAMHNAPFVAAQQETQQDEKQAQLYDYQAKTVAWMKQLEKHIAKGDVLAIDSSWDMDCAAPNMPWVIEYGEQAFVDLQQYDKSRLVKKRKGVSVKPLFPPLETRPGMLASNARKYASLIPKVALPPLHAVVKDKNLLSAPADMQRFIKIKGGFLADEMGLGKTLTLLSLVAAHPFNKDDTVPIHGAYLATKATLVICPSQLAEQWVKEAEKFSFAKPKKASRKRKASSKEEEEEEEEEATQGLVIRSCITKSHHNKLTYQDVMDCDILLITREFLFGDYYTKACKEVASMHAPPSDRGTKAPYLHHFWWHRLILDESHEIKIGEMLENIPSSFRWLVSGTPFAESLVGFVQACSFLQMQLCFKYPAPEHELKVGYKYISSVRNVNRALLETPFGILVDQCIQQNLFYRNTKSSIGHENTIAAFTEELVLLDGCDVDYAIQRAANCMDTFSPEWSRSKLAAYPFLDHAFRYSTTTWKLGLESMFDGKHMRAQEEKKRERLFKRPTCLDSNVIRSCYIHALTKQGFELVGQLRELKQKLKHIKSRIKAVLAAKEDCKRNRIRFSYDVAFPHSVKLHSRAGAHYESALLKQSRMEANLDEIRFVLQLFRASQGWCGPDTSNVFRGKKSKSSSTSSKEYDMQVQALVQVTGCTMEEASSLYVEHGGDQLNAARFLIHQGCSSLNKAHQMYLEDMYSTKRRGTEHLRIRFYEEKKKKDDSSEEEEEEKEEEQAHAEAEEEEEEHGSSQSVILSGKKDKEAERLLALLHPVKAEASETKKEAETLDWSSGFHGGSSFGMEQTLDDSETREKQDERLRQQHPRLYFRKKWEPVLGSYDASRLGASHLTYVSGGVPNALSREHKLYTAYDREQMDVWGVKLFALIKYLKQIGADDASENKSVRVLIFSQFTPFLKTIRAALGMNGISSLFCIGNVWSRVKAIRGFQQPMEEPKKKKKRAKPKAVSAPESAETTETSSTKRKREEEHTTEKPPLRLRRIKESEEAPGWQLITVEQEQKEESELKLTRRKVRPTNDNDEDEVVEHGSFATTAEQVQKDKEASSLAPATVKVPSAKKKAAVDVYKVLLMDLEKTASGTNLTQTTHVILMEPVGQSKAHAIAAEAQARGRALRQGNTTDRTVPLKVVRFAMRDTVEHDRVIRNWFEQEDYSVD